MAKIKAPLKTPSISAGPKTEGPKTNGTAEINPVQEWQFKITGRGTSGWMSWVKEGSAWIKLRPSETSFVSAVAAIEPEVMRLAFPHSTTKRKIK